MIFGVKTDEPKLMGCLKIWVKYKILLEKLGSDPDHLLNSATAR